LPCDALSLASFPTRRSSDLPPVDRLALRPVFFLVLRPVAFLVVFLVVRLVVFLVLFDLALRPADFLDPLPRRDVDFFVALRVLLDRKSTRLNSSHVKISYAV